jgi:hypothetical protein
MCTLAVFHNLTFKTQDTVLNKICNSIHVGLSFPLGLVSLSFKTVFKYSIKLSIELSW